MGFLLLLQIGTRPRVAAFLYTHGACQSPIRTQANDYLEKTYTSPEAAMRISGYHDLERAEIRTI
jgi:hypothetical protein